MGGKREETRLTFSPRFRDKQHQIDRNKARQEATGTYFHAISLHPNYGGLCAKCIGEWRSWYGNLSRCWTRPRVWWPRRSRRQISCDFIQVVTSNRRGKGEERGKGGGGEGRKKDLRFCLVYELDSAESQ